MRNANLQGFGENGTAAKTACRLARHANDRLRVEYRPASALIPFAKNARTHSDAQIAQIAGSIREFGWTNPILVDGDNGIIAGQSTSMPLTMTRRSPSR